MTTSAHYDLIVVGSGAGGATLAHRLAPTGKRILVLERGDWLPREAENWSSREVFGRHRYASDETWRDGAGKSFTPSTLYRVGGNTKIYGATLLRLRERDFAETVHADGVSPAWPLTYADFAPYYLQAERLYQVHGTRGADPTEPPEAEPYPYPALAHEPLIAALADDLARIGCQPFPLPLALRVDAANPRASPCIRCGTCDGFPCLLHAKCDADITCMRPALACGNVELLTNAHVQRLETDSSGRAVKAVHVRRGDEALVFSADIVVVAGGAINSAALLLRSRSEQHPHGLANGSGAVGRHYMCHNNSAFMALTAAPNPTRFQKTFGLNDFYLGNDESPPLGHIQMLGKADGGVLGAQLPSVVPLTLLDRVGRHSIDFWIMSEDLPAPDNRVTIDADGTIRLAYRPNNLAAHGALDAKLREVLTRAQRRKSFVPDRAYFSMRIPLAGVAHQCGTVRFGPDPASLGARSRLPRARGRQPLRRRRQLLPRQRGGEPDADDHRQRLARGRRDRRAAQGRASNTRLNGVSVARWKWLKPPSLTAPRKRFSPACAPSARPTACDFEAGVLAMAGALGRAPLACSPARRQDARMQSAQIIVLATPVFLGLIALEWWVGRRRGRDTYRASDAMSSIGLGIMSQIVGLAGGLVLLGVYTLAHRHLALFELSAGDWWVWALGLVLYDLCYYWHHRLGHTCAFFWAAHVVHHQSEDYNLSTALRQTSTGFLGGWLFYLPMAVLGFPPLVYAVVALVDLLYQYWVHTQQIGRLGWFDRWFCAPSNHRVHHAVNERYLDRNYGGILLVWDRLFGSWEPEHDDEPCVYGTRAPLQSWNPLKANLQVYASLWHDSRHAGSWADTLRVWLKPPGWRPADVAERFPKPAFDIARAQRYDPPLAARHQRASLALFALLLAATAALLWTAHTLAWPALLAGGAGIVAGLCAVAWLCEARAPAPGETAAAQSPG